MGVGVVPGEVGHIAVEDVLSTPPPPIGIPVTNAITGWRVLGVHYTCSPNPVYPWDPAVIRGIWEFEPTWVPLWVTHEVIGDGMSSPVLFGNHAIGRVVDDPVMGTNYFAEAGCSVTMPTMPCQGISFKCPSHLELLIPWWDRYNALPFGPYYPFDWSVVKAHRAIHMQPDQAKHREVLNTNPRARWESEKRKRQEEQDYIARDVRKFTQNQLDKISDVEHQEYLRAGDEAFVAEPKPFVQVGG